MSTSKKSVLLEAFTNAEHPIQYPDGSHGLGIGYAGFREILFDLPAADVVERRSCNTCKYYEGVHNAKGCAPCSFLNIGCIMWNDFCSRWEKENG